MDKLKTLLKQIYGLEDTAEKKLEWKKIAYGMAGSNFEIIINGQTKYFFKIVPLTKQEINKNLKVSALMQMNNIEVTMPLPSLKGNLYELDDEGKVCLLYNFIKGVRFLEVDISKKEKAIKTIANNLARLHIAGSNILDSRIPKIKESRVLQNFKINKLKRKELISEFKNDSKKILDKINTDSMEDIIHDKNKQILAMKDYFIDNNI